MTPLTTRAFITTVALVVITVVCMQLLLHALDVT